MVMPWTWNVTHSLSVTKLQSDGFGGTNVEGTFDGTPFKPFVLKQDVAVVGADVLRVDIESVVDGLIEDALELAE